MRTSRGVAILGAMHDLLLTPHVIAGVVALASMIVPLVARKGGRLHRRAGWVFVIAMIGGIALVASGAPAHTEAQRSPGVGVARP